MHQFCNNKITNRRGFTALLISQWCNVVIYWIWLSIAASVLLTRIVARTTEPINQGSLVHFDPYTAWMEMWKGGTGQHKCYLKKKRFQFLAISEICYKSCILTKTCAHLNTTNNCSETVTDNNWVTEALKFWVYQVKFHSLLDVDKRQISGWVGILEGLCTRLLHACQNSLFPQAWDHN